jgi:acetamidase/formamidase
MSLHRFKSSRFHNTIGSHPPAYEIGNGNSVVTETLDAHGFDAFGVQRGHDPNPMTGPFFVTDAKPGDGLRVRIERIDLISSSGWTRQGLAPHVVDPTAVTLLPPREKIDWLIDNNSGTARPRLPPEGVENWSVGLAPMIGCFGVAPADGQAISTATSGPYGGNMDYRGFGEGVEVLFPVFAEGALFFLGDVHAAQGAGEIAGTGIETAAEVQFTVHVEKGLAPGWPRGETADAIFTVGNARPLDQALQHATTEMMSWLMTHHGLSAIAAGQIMGQTVAYEIANVFNPAYSVVCRIDRRSIPDRAL